MSTMTKAGTRAQALFNFLHRWSTILLWRVGGLLAVLWFGAWLWLGGYIQSGWSSAHEFTRTKLAEAGFAVEDVLLEGRVHADASVINAVLNIQHGDSLFFIDVYEVQKLLEQVNWVETAHVEKHWPDTLAIRIIERKPGVILNENGQKQILDTQGRSVPGADLDQFQYLFTVSGQGAQKKVPALLAELKNTPGITAKIGSANYIGQRRWDLILKNGVAVKLPETGLDKALQTLVSMDAQYNLLQKDLMHLDLRTPGSVYVRTRPGNVQEYKAKLKHSL